MKKTLTPQEHQVWLTIYNTSLETTLARPASGAMAIRRNEPPPNPHAFAANNALEAYRKACTP